MRVRSTPSDRSHLDGSCGARPGCVGAVGVPGRDEREAGQPTGAGDRLAPASFFVLRVPCGAACFLPLQRRVA